MPGVFLLVATLCVCGSHAKTIADLDGVWQGELAFTLFSLGHGTSCCEGCLCTPAPTGPSGAPTQVPSPAPTAPTQAPTNATAVTVVNSSNTSSPTTPAPTPARRQFSPARSREVQLMAAVVSNQSSGRQLLSDSRRQTTTVCVAQQVKVNMEVFIDSSTNALYYYNAEVEAVISGRAMHLEEVKTNGKITEYYDSRLGMVAWSKSAATSCARFSITSLASSDVTTVSYGMTNGVGERYLTCDKAAKAPEVACTLNEPAEYSVRGVLTRLTDEAALEVKNKHGWVSGVQSSTFCTANKPPFNYFGPVDCNFVEIPESIPTWVFIAAALVAVLLCAGGCFTGWRWAIIKFGRSRSFLCIICIFSYQGCYAEKSVDDEDVELNDLDRTKSELKKKQHLYKPGWAQKYGNQDSSWSKFAG